MVVHDGGPVSVMEVASAPEVVAASDALTSREQAAVERDQCSATAEAWLRDKARTEQALAEALRRSEDLLAPEQAVEDEIDAEVMRLRARLRTGDRMLSGAARRYGDAAGRALLAEAEELEAAIAEARSNVEAFESETERLKTALESHAGGNWAVLSFQEERERGLGPSELRDVPLRAQLQTLLDQQSALRSAAQRVPPLRLVSRDWAEASVRLLAVSGDVSESARANVAAVGADLEAQASALEDERGARLYVLGQAIREEAAVSRRPMAPGMTSETDEFLLSAWEPDPAATAVAREQKRLDAELTADQRRLGMRPREVNAHRVEAIRAEQEPLRVQLIAAQQEAKRLAEEQARLRAEAAVLAVAMTRTRELAPL